MALGNSKTLTTVQSDLTRKNSFYLCPFLAKRNRIARNLQNVK